MHLSLSLLRSARAIVVVASIVLATIGVLAAPGSAATPERAVLAMPFDGRWANSYATAPWEHNKTYLDDWAMDIYGLDAPVRAGIVTATGAVTLTVTNVDHSVGSCGSGGGVLVQVAITVDGTHVGDVGYYHLRSVAVHAGQRVTPDTVLGRTAAYPTQNSGPCWQVSTDRGVHTHFTIAGNPPTACFVSYAKGEQLSPTAPLAVLGQYDDGRPVATNERQACAADAATVEPTVTAFRTIDPQRIFDTRTPAGSSGRVRPGTMIEVDVVPGVQPDVKAVALNVTAVDATNDGYVTVYPGDARLPYASNLNLVRGQTTAGMVVVGVSDDGLVRFHTSGGAHLVADLVGTFVEADRSRAGRIVPLTPRRLLDTRDTGRVASQEAVTVKVAGRGGVPRSGVAAVVVNVTATEAAGAGYVTVHEAGGPRPNTSNLNPEYPGHTVANLAIVPVSPSGHIELFSFNSADLVVDVTGYITDESAPLSSSGLFVPTMPRRAFDTRTGAWPSGRVGGETPLRVPLAARGVPKSAGGAFITLTATQASGQGYVTAWPSGSARPTASTLNLNHAGETRPNAALLPVGFDSSLSFVASGGAHLVVDVAGWITG